VIRGLRSSLRERLDDDVDNETVDLQVALPIVM
jgi:hypothetical protein